MSHEPSKPFETYRYLKGYILANGYAPSLREMCTDLNITSPAAAKRRLQALADMGWIEVTPKRARAVRLMK